MNTSNGRARAGEPTRARGQGPAGDRDTGGNRDPRGTRDSGGGRDSGGRDSGGPDGGGRDAGGRDSGARRGGAKAEVVFGKHSVRAIFRSRPESIRTVAIREGAAQYLEEFIDLAHAAGLEPEMMRSGEFLRYGGLGEDDKHQGVFVIADPLPVYSEYDFHLLDDASVVVVLDQLSNPQNFGTIIRTAAFYGVDGIIWLKNRAVDIDATVIRVAVGGTELVKLFRVTNLARALELLKERGFWVYGFDERGDSTLSETVFDSKTAVIIGAEGEGMRQRTKQYCDVLVSIAGGQPGLESLNAAVAAGIVMAEVRRPRP